MATLKELNLDIQRQEKIYSNSAIFIIYRNLEKIKIKSYLDLPPSAYIGSVWLINGNTIVEIYSYYRGEEYHSMASFLHVADEFKNVFNVKKDIISYDRLETLNFIIKLINAGFELYIKKLV